MRRKDVSENTSARRQSSWALAWLTTNHESDTFKSEVRRQKAPRQESLYSKVFNLFQLDSYLCRAALVTGDWTLLTPELI